MQSGSTAKGQWVEEWREKEVGNRLQIVSLARFGCVLTCGGGGQGKARQGEKNMSAKAEGNKNNTKWKWRRKKQSGSEAGSSARGEESSEKRRAGQRERAKRSWAFKLRTIGDLILFFSATFFIHICAIFVAVIVVLYMRHICCCYCYCCCYSVAIVGKLKSWEQLSNGTNRRRISFQFRFANFSPLSNVLLLLLCLCYYYCCCCWRSLLGARLEASRRRWFFLRLIPITWDTTWN